MTIRPKTTNRARSNDPVQVRPSVANDGGPSRARQPTSNPDDAQDTDDASATPEVSQHDPIGNLRHVPNTRDMTWHGTHRHTGPSQGRVAIEAAAAVGGASSNEGPLRVTDRGSDWHSDNDNRRKQVIAMG